MLDVWCQRWRNLVVFVCLFVCFFFGRDGINICTALNWVMQHE